MHAAQMQGMQLADSFQLLAPSVSASGAGSNLAKVVSL